ncbi:MAG TPA: hypothetical protein VGM88_34800 [Kofleriaceae bacterium]|jgi:hypothetical protein
MHRLLFAVALVAGCGDDPPSCITVDTSCAPLYAPTFDNVYNITIAQSCGRTDGSCHSDAGREGGMTFADEQTTYTELLSGRVVPMNPGCSKMIVRTDSPGKDYQMPPGDALSAPERCALIQWVQAGAPGPQ